MSFVSVPSIIRSQLRPAILIFLVLTLVTGICYPLLITGIAQLAFPAQANGNLIVHDGKVVGSALHRAAVHITEIFLGQTFCNHARTLQCRTLIRLEPRTIEPGIN